MDLTTFLAVSAAAGLGGCVQGFAGFGSTLVALPLLGLVMDVRVAVPVCCLLGLGVNIMLLSRPGNRVDRKALVLLLAASAPGMAAGAAILGNVPGTWLKALLGVSVSWMALRSLLAGPARAPAGTGLGVAAGLAAGCLGVAIGINGPPIVAWTARQPWDRETFKATLNAYFLLSGVGIVAVQAFEGLVTPEVSGLALAGIVALLAGVRLGLLLCRRCDERTFRHGVFGLLALTGLGLLWQVAAGFLAGA